MLKLPSAAADLKDAVVTVRDCFGTIDGQSAFGGGNEHFANQ